MGWQQRVPHGSHPTHKLSDIAFPFIGPHITQSRRNNYPEKDNGKNEIMDHGEVSLERPSPLKAIIEREAHLEYPTSAFSRTT